MFALVLTLVFFFCLDAPVHCVDRSNFKTCEQSSFCSRQRTFGKNTVFRVDPNSVKVKPDGVAASLITEQDSTILPLEITFLEHSVFHVLIDEISDEYKRFRIPAGDVVLEKLISKPVTVIKKQDSIVLSGEDNVKAVIQMNPFLIEFYMDDVLVSTINRRSLLNFEHQRQLPIPEKVEPVKQTTDTSETVSATEHTSTDTQSPTKTDDPYYSSTGESAIPTETQPMENTDDDKNSAESTETSTNDQANWDESFKGHVDSRPKGLNSILVDVEFHDFGHAYGIPEHADSFKLRETTSTDPYRLYNLDVFEYELNNPMALYGSVPLMWVHNANFTVGLFWSNPSETWIDVQYIDPDNAGLLSKLPRFFSSTQSTEKSIKTKWISESGLIDSYVILGRSPSDALKAYASLTGTTALPPLFALGYHQCRWNYKDEADVSFVDENFDKHVIPVDVIWLDIEHTDGKRYFTWDSVKFPNPSQMVDKLLTKGRKLVTVVDPHIKVDSNWDIFSYAESNGLYIKSKDGTPFQGWCWPGSSKWPDFTSPKVREWWSDLFKTYEPVRPNTMYTWNDMGEPSIFNGPEITLHKDAIHFGDWEHRDVHNLYGLYVHMATWEGQLKRSNRLERPFVLTRAFFAGSQRTAAVWTGDNAARWDHLKISIPMLLSLSISGITLCGADVGGFFGNPDWELSTRWYQAAAYQPFFRAHAHLDTQRREPWLAPPEHMSIIRDAIQARYRLLPYWYTVFAESEADGQPVLAPLWFHFPKDSRTYDLDEQHMVGKNLLVRPVVDQGAQYVTIYFPSGIWYHNPSFHVIAGNQTVQYPVTLSSIPVFYRGGSIIPRQERIRRSSWRMANDPYTLIVLVDPDQPESVGHIYLDDFHTTQRQNAQYYRMTFHHSSGPTGTGGGQLQLTKLPVPGSQRIAPTKVEPASVERIVLVGLLATPQRITVIEKSGKRRDVQFTVSKAIQKSGVVIPQIVVVRQPVLVLDDSWVLHVVTGLETRDDL